MSVIISVLICSAPAGGKSPFAPLDAMMPLAADNETKENMQGNQPELSTRQLLVRLRWSGKKHKRGSDKGFMQLNFRRPEELRAGKKDG